MLCLLLNQTKLTSIWNFTIQQNVFFKLQSFNTSISILVKPLLRVQLNFFALMSKKRKKKGQKIFFLSNNTDIFSFSPFGQNQKIPRKIFRTTGKKRNLPFLRSIFLELIEFSFIVLGREDQSREVKNNIRFIRLFEKWKLFTFENILRNGEKRLRMKSQKMRRR